MMDFSNFNHDTLVSNLKEAVKMVANHQTNATELSNDVMDYFTANFKLSEKETQEAISVTDGGVWAVLSYLDKNYAQEQSIFQMGRAENVALTYIYLQSRDMLKKAYRKADIKFSDFSDADKWVPQLISQID